MPNIDIQIQPDLQALMNLPPCDQIRLPAPSPISVQLPTGAFLKSFEDISKGIPTECSMTFNLLVQIAPLLASMECIVKILKLLKPLIDVINGLPVPPIKAIQDFAKAAADLVPCFLIPTPANLIPFIRDILCLVLKVLRCFLGQMETVIGLLGGLQIQISAAQAAGNTDLLNALQCAQENGQTSAQHLTSSIEPIGIILDLIGPLMGIAGVQPIQLPSMGKQTDVQALQQGVQTMQSVVATIQSVVDTLGGCS